ncbi:hypothetical protein R3P38DRAFT_3208578 [Favolaschia claudopus]|uniref:Uncharacterized protein n=1 Tax=Favolaschia claudopus TaxID=2862362 RepID=A0AAW0AJ02_9AGAR
MARMPRKDQSKRQRKRVAKEKRKNLKLWAEGARESVLKPHIDGYQKAMDKGWRHERKYWKKVCREFHARIDWRTKDHEEPTIREWNEASTIEEEELSPEEEALRSERVATLNARMRRWFVYRVRKLRKRQRTSGIDPLRDPYAILLAKLSGLTAPPKARQAYQQYMREEYSSKIAPQVAEDWQKELASRAGSMSVGDDPKSREPKAGFRAAVARKMFAALPNAEQQAYAARAKAEAAEAKQAYVQALKDPPSQSPEARQKCIDSASEFVAPILRGINAATGLHATLIMGGPIPEFGGELRTVHVSYGQNHTAAADHWPQWDKNRFSDQVLQFMIEYLGTAYTHDERAKAALGSAASLADAPYTMSQEPGSDSESDSGSDSDSSDSDSDESVDSDADQPPRKKRKTSGKRAEKPSPPVRTVSNGVQPAAAVSTVPSEPHSSPSPPPDDSVPPPEPAQHPSVSEIGAASAAATALSSPTRRPLASTGNDIDTGKQAPKQHVGHGWFMDENERQQNVARNQLLFQQLKENFDQNLGPLRQELKGVAEAEAGEEDAAGPGGDDGMQVDVEGVVRDDAGGGGNRGDSGSGAGGEASGSGSGAVVSAVGEVLGTSEADGHHANDGGDDIDTVAGAPPISSAAQRAIGDRNVIPPPTVISPASEFVPCPSAAPKWFVDAHRLMTHDDLGCHYHALVAAWTRMEKASRFEHGPTKLPHKLRPQQVSTWITSGRRAAPPAVQNPADYAVIWQAWWDSLQPSWRSRDGDGRWSIVDGYGMAGREWGPLYHWGANGVLSVRERWEIAVGDAVWMFEGMATYYEMFKGKF